MIDRRLEAYFKVITAFHRLSPETRVTSAHDYFTGVMSRTDFHPLSMQRLFEYIQRFSHATG